MPLNFPDPYNLKPVNLDTYQEPSPQVVTPYEASSDRLADYNGLSFGDRVAVATEQKTAGDFSTVDNAQLSKRYPVYYPGMDNEDLYAQGQSGWAKAKNGVAKMSGIAAGTFVDGTAGLVYGIYSSIKDGKLSEIFDNSLTQKVNDLTNQMEDALPHYYTERERNGHWWEPANLFTGNFFWDKVVKNLGFSIGAFGSGFAISGALEATGLVSKLAGMGKSWATEALTAIEESSALPEVERLPNTLNKLRSLYTQAKGEAGQALMKSNQFITALGGSFGEGSMEAYNNMHEFRKNMIDEFTKKYGYAPSDEDLAEINKYSENVGKWSLGLNVALLTATNYIQLPKIFSSSFKAEKSELNNIAFNAEKQAWENSLPTSKLGKLAYGAYKGASLGFNTSEAFEEGAQYAIQTGTENYFGRQYHNREEGSFADNLAGLLFNKDGLPYGVEQTLTTDEGLENIFLGGFSGALQSAGIVGQYEKDGKTGYGFFKSGKIGERGVFGFGGENAKLRNEAIAAWNNSSFSSKLKSFADNINRSAVTQEQRAGKIAEGDVLESKDLEFDYAHDYITSRLKYGGMSAITRELADARAQAMSEEGLLKLKNEGKAAQTDTQESFLKRLNTIESHAKDTNKLYDQINLKYKGLVTPEGARVYPDEVIDKMVYAASKIKDYDERIPELSNNLISLGIDVQGTVESFSDKDKLAQIDKEQIQKIKDLKSVDEDDLVRDYRDISRMTKRRAKFLDEYNELKNNPEKYKPKPKSEPKATTSKTIKLKTLRGEEDFEIGKQYFAGAVVKKAAEGQYRDFTRFTIVGEHENGNIIIKTSDGKLLNIPKSAFEKYKINSVEEAGKHPGAVFYMENSHRIFKYQRKGQEPLEGQLEYDSDHDQLLFKTLDGKKTFKVFRDQFTPKLDKEGKPYSKAQIYSDTEFSQASKDALAQPVSAEEKAANRSRIISDLYNKSVKRLSEVKERLRENKAKIKDIEESLDNLSKTKEGLPRKKFTKSIRKTILQLSDTKDALLKEINQLEDEKDELETTLPYFRDLYDNSYELPEEGKEVVAQLRSDISTLEELIDNTNSAISNGKSLIEQIDNALRTAASLLSDFVKRLREENPNIPLSLDEFEQNIAKFYGEEGAKQFIQDRLGFTEAVLDLESQINEFSGELKIPDMEKKINNLQNQIKELSSGLNDLIAEQLAKEKILEAFEKFAQEYAKSEAIKKQLKDDKNLKEELFKKPKFPNNNPTETTAWESDPKKPLQNLFGSTIAFSKNFSQGPEKPHYKRANYFGGILPNLSDRDDYKGVLIHEGMGGIFSKIVETSGKYPNETEDNKSLVLLVVKETKDGWEYVDEFGKPIGKLGEDVDVDKLVFQSMPAASTTNSKNISRVRSNESEETAKEYMEQYKQSRKEFFAQTSPTSFFSISASFGLPIKDKVNGTPIYENKDTKHPVTTIAPINQIEIKVSTTTDEKVRGIEGEIKLPNGRPAAVTSNKVTPLQNRKLTKTEISVITKILLKLAEFAENKTLNNTNELYNTYLDYLKGVIYWGIPANEAGRNSIWFTQDKQTQEYYLHIGNNDNKVSFLTMDFHAQQGIVAKFLSEAYNNVNNSYLSAENVNKPFFEIIDLKEDGTPIYRNDTAWKNYKEFLISPEGRSVEELPLTTTIAPFIQDNNMTRDGIYFVLEEFSQTFHKKETKNTPVPKAKTDSEEETISMEQLANALGAKENKPAENKPVPKQTKSSLVPTAEEFAAAFASMVEGKQETPTENIQQAEALNSNITAEQVRNKLQEIEKQPIKINITQDANGKIEQTSEQIIADIKNELDKTGLPYSDVVSNDKGSTYFVVTKDGQQHEILKVLQSGGKTLPTILTKAKWINHLIKTEKDAVVNVVENLLGKKSEQPTPTSTTEDTEQSESFKQFKENREKSSRPKRNTRLVTPTSRVSRENWGKVEKWLRKNYPNIPVYRVENILPIAQNTYAWGFFADGAIYLYKNAELGTTYHEIFHAVMDKFSNPEEKVALFNEFTKRKGSYVDRAGKTIKYSEASYDEMEEKLAEEFRGYVLRQSSILGRIGDFFRQLYDFIRGVSEGKINQLFKDINAGKYREYVSGIEDLRFANQGFIDIDEVTSKFSDLKAMQVLHSQLPAVEEKDMLDHMTSLAFDYLFEKEKNLFKEEALKKSKFYDALKESVIDTLVKYPLDDLDDVEDKISKEEYIKRERELASLYDKINNNWDFLKTRHEINMRSFNLEFDENDELVDTNATGRETGQDAMSIDHIRKANMAIKLLMATLRDVEFLPNTENNVLAPTKYKTSSINGDVLLPFGKTFVQTLNGLANAPNFDKQMDALLRMAKNNPVYSNLFTRLKGSRTDGKIQWNSLSVHDLQLLIAFSRTFSKQAPEVINHYIGEDEDAYLAAGSLANVASQLMEKYEQSILRKIRTTGLFEKVNTKDVKGYRVKKGQPQLSKGYIDKDSGKLKFLSDLGIEIEFQKLNREGKQVVRDAVSGIHTALNKAAASGSVIATFTGKTLGLQTRLYEIAETQAAYGDENTDAVAFNIEGEMRPVFVEKNYISKFADTINDTTSLEDLEGTNFSYLLTDAFSKNSMLMKDTFTEGIRSGKIRTGYVDGTVNRKSGKATGTDRLSKGARLLQQINLQLSGWYYTLVPADATTEWMMQIRNYVSYDFVKRTSVKNTQLYDIFKGYLEDEIAVAQEERKHSIQVSKSSGLRFFSSILSESLAKKAVETKDFEKFYKDNEDKINKAIDDFFTKNAEELKAQLKEYQLVKSNEEGDWEFKSLDTSKLEGFNKNGFKEETLDYLTKYLAINYAIANIEMFKTVFGDPYEYKDVLKRIKSFLSPAETTMHSSKEINQYLDKFYNKGLKSSDLGWRQFGEYLKTATLADVKVLTELYKDSKPWDEADGQGIILDIADREFKIKASLWNDNFEEQYQYDMAWMRNYFEEKGKYKYSDAKLKENDKKLLEVGNPIYKNHLSNTSYKKDYVTKPIVRGNKYDSDINAPMIDKYSLAPLTLRTLVQMNPDSNMVRLYEKMLNEKIDYAIFESGRKVGNEYSNDVYNEDGLITSNPFQGIVKVPFENISIQVQTIPKEESSGTLGSQLTKLAHLNMMANGVPIDYLPSENENVRWLKWQRETNKEKASPLYADIQRNIRALENMINYGYETLLKKLGVEEVNNRFIIKDRKKATEVLKNEILRREVDDNVINTLLLFEDNKISLEASPAYQQFKNILYSLVDKNVVSMKVNGGPKVQMASTFFENKRGIEKTIINGKAVYSSTDLAFYKDEDGQRVIEIYLPAWFLNKLPENLRKLSDAELIKLVDPSVLEGIGFRIPTQEMNSIDVIRVKGFLPQEMGDTVIVPSEMVKKAGSDFDIDKLSTYLKNLYFHEGKLKEVKYFENREEHNRFYGELYDEKIKNSKIEKEKGILSLLKDVDVIDTILNSNENLEEKLLGKNAHLDNVIQSFGDDFDDAANFLLDKVEELRKDVSKLNDKKLQEELKQTFIERMYKQSLQNEYFNSLQKLIQNPLNFENLVRANDATPMKELSNEITKLRKLESDDASSPGELLKLPFMLGVRHNFASSKQLVGIGAVNQTGLSNRQKSLIYIDPEKLENMSPELSEWLGDAKINLPHNTIVTTNGKTVSSLSGMYAKGTKDLISQVNSMAIDGAVDVAKGAWLSRLLGNTNIFSTFLFLNSVGVPLKTNAYFINQPIIQDYLKMIDTAGYRWLFIGDFVDTISGSSKYSTGTNVDASFLQEKNITSTLQKMVGKDELNDIERARQQVILTEFLKYAKMAQHLFLVTNGTNYDTATINDPYLELQKQKQLEKARQTIISSADDILENTHIGNVRDKFIKSRNAIAPFLPTEGDRARAIIESVLEDFVDLPQKQFIGVARKVVSSFLDFVIQTYAKTDGGVKLNDKIHSLMVNESTNVSNKLKELMDSLGTKDALRSNPVIKSMLAIQPNKVGGVFNLKLVGKNNEAYQKNSIIKGFEELKTNPLFADTYENGVRKDGLYRQIVRASILQGMANSPISFTQFLPVEDLSSNLQTIMELLPSIPHLENFKQIEAFERNNWGNSDIVPSQNFGWDKRHFTKYGLKIHSFTPQYQNFVDAGGQVIVLDSKSRISDNDVISISYRKRVDSEGKEYTKERMEHMRKVGDYSYIYKSLFKRVYDKNTKEPMRIYYTFKKGGREIQGFRYVYRAINAWGDSYKLQEYYMEPRPSQVNNGFEKIQNEFTDEFVQDVIEKGMPKDKVSIDSSKKINIYAGTNENADLSNFAVRPVTNPLGVTYKTVEGAYQAAKINFATGNNDEIDRKLQTASGAEAKKLGSQIKGLNVKAWDENSSAIMKSIIKDSFIQNPKALEKLLATGNAQLTHTQDNSKWKTEFPKLLMEVRAELSKTIQPSGKPAIQDNITYSEFMNDKGTATQRANFLTNLINSYNPQEIIINNVAFKYNDNEAFRKNKYTGQSAFEITLNGMFELSARTGEMKLDIRKYKGLEQFLKSQNDIKNLEKLKSIEDDIKTYDSLVVKVVANPSEENVKNYVQSNKKGLKIISEILNSYLKQIGLPELKINNIKYPTINTISPEGKPSINDKNKNNCG